MTESSQLGPALERRILDFARSDLFMRTFSEGMTLVEETAAYLDGPGRAASKRLDRNSTLSYAAESMRLTTRLMQVASWLLVQRALREGDLPVSDALEDKYRISQQARAQAEQMLSQLADAAIPEALLELIRRADSIYDRVRRLDEQIYAEASTLDADQTQGARAQFDLLRKAFGQP